MRKAVVQSEVKIKKQNHNNNNDNNNNNIYDRKKRKEKEIKKLIKMTMKAIILMMISWCYKTMKMRNNAIARQNM